MDPCPYLRIAVSNLHLQLPSTAVEQQQPPPSSTCVHPSPSTPSSFCLLKLHHLPKLFSSLPCVPSSTSGSATFHLTASDLRRLSSKPSPNLSISIFSSPGAVASCGGGLFSSRSSAKKLGKVRVPLDLQAIIEGNSHRASILYSGWVPLGNQKDRKGKEKKEGKQGGGRGRSRV